MTLVCVLKDEKSGVCQHLFSHRSRAEAVRALEVAVNEGDSMIRRFPADFALYHVADFDENLCLIEKKEPMERICFGSDLVRKPQVADPQLPFVKPVQ